MVALLTYPEWEVVQPLLAKHQTGASVLNVINQAHNFNDLIEPITQALAQYKLFPDMDEFVDTLHLCISEMKISAQPPVESPKPTHASMDNLWLIPTFDEDVRMANRKPSLLAFQKRVEGAFHMIGRPSTQEVEVRTSAKLAVPTASIYSGGYATLSASATLERTSKLEEARKTMFGHKTVVEAGIPPTVQSFTPYQSSYTFSVPQETISMNATQTAQVIQAVDAAARMAQGASMSSAPAHPPGYVPPRLGFVGARDMVKHIKESASHLFGRFLEIVNSVKDRSQPLNTPAKELLELFKDHEALRMKILEFFPACASSVPVIVGDRKNQSINRSALRQRIGLRGLARAANRASLGQEEKGDEKFDDSDDDEGTASAASAVATLASRFAQIGDKFQSIRVVSLTGKHMIFENTVGPKSTVLQLKEALTGKEGIPVDAQRLIFAGKQLEDHRTLGEYFIQEGATMHLVLRLRATFATKSPAASSSKVPTKKVTAPVQRKPEARKKKVASYSDSDGSSSGSDSDSDESPKKKPLATKKAVAKKREFAKPEKKARTAKKAVVPVQRKPEARKKKVASDSDGSSSGSDSDSDESPKKKHFPKSQKAVPQKRVTAKPDKKAPPKMLLKKKVVVSDSDSDGSDSDSGVSDGSEEMMHAARKAKRPETKKRASPVQKKQPAASSSSYSSARIAALAASPSNVAKISSAWEKHGTVWIRGANNRISASDVAAFDMDSTLISVKSGAKFPKDHTDWKWCEGVVSKLTDLMAQGTRIVIITNQNGIEKGSQRAEDILTKIDTMAAQLGETPNSPILALVATSKDKYRKPSPIIWDLFIEKLNVGVVPSKAFFVGDAAGRPHRDHSCADRSFARNAGIPFFTEDAYFLGTSPQAIEAVPFPEDLLVTEFKQQAQSGVAKPYVIPPANGPVELVLMCGMPGSGKSTIFRSHFEPLGYLHVNLDTVKNPAKCLQLTTDALKAGKSVVVDQTFPNPEKRMAYTDLAKSLGVPVRIITISIPMPIANHLNTIRSWISGQPHVPIMVYHMFLKGYQAPTIQEGYDAIIHLNFQFNSTDPKVISAIQWYTE
jgi:bifunctional polynucleotide phosphatase/kinase